MPKYNTILLLVCFFSVFFLGLAQDGTLSNRLTSLKWPLVLLSLSLLSTSLSAVSPLHIYIYFNTCLLPLPLSTVVFSLSHAQKSDLYLLFSYSWIVFVHQTLFCIKGGFVLCRDRSRESINFVDEMEAGVMQREGDRFSHVKRAVGYVNKGIEKRKCRRRNNRIKQKPEQALQQLFVSCLHLFKGPGTVPPPQDVHKLCRILDNIKPEDVGLSSKLEFFKPTNVVKPDSRITYTTIYKCDNFSLCIFFLPATGVIPLHNHPGMTVFSKLLLGTMHIKSYDWVDPNDIDGSVPSSQLRLAELKADSVFTAPCDTSVLYPTTGGNIHAFTAITPCAVLDVLGPPYSKEDGRDCSFYKDYPCTASNGDTSVTSEEADSYGWLEEIEMPENSQMDGIEYLGPQVIEPS